MHDDTDASADDPRTWHAPGVTCMSGRIKRLTPITDRQREVLAFVAEHVEASGYAPTVREVAARFGWRSTRTAGEHLHELARKGALEITPGVARGIRVLDARGLTRGDPRGRAAAGPAPVEGC